MIVTLRYVTLNNDDYESRKDNREKDAKLFRKEEEITFIRSMILCYDKNYF